jgi:hypothetical protein
VRKLDLDFNGTLSVKGVTLGGRQKSLIINASTCRLRDGAGAVYAAREHW